MKKYSDHDMVNLINFSALVEKNLQQYRSIIHKQRMSKSNVKVELLMEEEDYYTIHVEFQAPDLKLSFYDLTDLELEEWSTFLDVIEGKATEATARAIYLRGDSAEFTLTEQNDFLLRMTIHDYELVTSIRVNRESGIEFVKKMIEALKEYQCGQISPNQEFSEESAVEQGMAKVAI